MIRQVKPYYDAGITLGGVVYAVDEYWQRVVWRQGRTVFRVKASDSIVTTRHRTIEEARAAAKDAHHA